MVEPLETRCVFSAGDLNPSFGGGDGVTALDHFAKQLIESGEAFAIQPDGKMLIAGSGTDGFGRFFPDFLLVRLNADGTPDATFGTGGQINLDFGGAYTSQEEAFAITIQPDGKIIVGGRASLTATEAEPLNYDFALARFTANGSLDASFGSGGKVRTDLGSVADSVRGLALAPDGSIYAVGESGGNAAVAHYTAAGVLDTGFDTDGKLVLDLGGADTLRGVAVQADGKLVAAGTTGLDFAAIRLTTAGGLDPGFGSSGIKLIDFGSVSEEARALAIDGGGRIVLGGGVRLGTAYDFALARLTSAGALDATFGVGGKFTFNASTNPTSGGAERIEGFAIQADGKIVVAGIAPDSINRSQWQAARVTTTGTLDSGFASGGIAHLAFEISTYGKVAGVGLSGGQLFVAGTRQSDNPLQPYSLGVMKLTTGGALDTSFSSDGLTLYNALGSAQNQGEVSTMLSDGRILVAENVRLTPRNALAGSVIALTMFGLDGLRDPSFGINGTVQVDLGLAASVPQALTVDANGKILIAGLRYFLPNGGAVLFGEATLARLNADGSFDTGFGTGGIVASPFFKDSVRQETRFNGVVVQPDGKIVTLGAVNTFDPKAGIVTLNRYLSDGTLDSTFAGDGRAEITLDAGFGSIDQIQLLPDGRFLLAGAAAEEKQLELLEVTATGALDTSFGDQGIAKPGLHGTIKKVLLNGDGTFDAITETLSPLAYAGFLVQGVTSPAIYQFTANGTLDPSFDSDGILNLGADLGFTTVGAATRDSSGRYLLGLSFEGLDHSTYVKFVRFNTDGSRDETFGTDEGTDLQAVGFTGTQAAYVRPDGSAVIVGKNTGTQDAYLASVITQTVVPPAGLLTFEARYSTVQESSGQALINVVRLGSSTGTVTVHYAITGGTATAGSDYTVVSGDLTFNAGVTSRQITIPLTIDNTGEIAETIQLTLSNPTGGAALDNPVKHQVTIAAHNGALGSVDPSFGAGGIAVSDHSIPSGSSVDQERVNAMTYAPDGSIIVVGTSGGSPDFFLSRFHADGTPDLSFGDRGSVTTDFGLSVDGAESVAVLADGRILVAGFGTSQGFNGAVHYGGDDHGLSGGLLQLMLVRYLPDGAIDRTYGQDGFVLVDPHVAFGRDGVNTETLSRDFVIQPDGEIYAGLVLRDFKADGSNGKIEAGLVHFRADGTLDTTLAGDGFAEAGLTASIFGGVALEEQTDGKFLLAFGTGDYHGDDEEKTALVRYTHAGALDSTFGTSGRLQIDVVADPQSPEIVTSLALQQDGKILLGGYLDTSAAVSGAYVIRLTTAGALDATFGTSGVASYHGLFPQSGSDAKIFDLAQLPNGRIAAVGQSLGGPGVESSQSPGVVIEFSAAGQLDPQFGINGAFRITSVGVSSSTPDAGLLITPANEIVAGFGGVLSTGSATNSQFVLQRFSTQGAAGRIEWSLDATSVDEADGLVGLTLKRVGGTVGAVSVDVNLVSGTATAGLDFINVGTQVTFLDGQTTLEILVPITRGDALESTETFSAVISNPIGGAILGAVSTELVSIVDGPDRLEFSSPVFNFIEGNQFVSVDVVRKGGATNAVSVDYALRGVEATNGLDFDALESGKLNFAAGQTTARITFALRADDLVEGREGIELTLLNPRGGPVLGNVATTKVNIYDLTPGAGLNAGALDARFGTKGVTSADVFAGSTSEQARDIVAQPDGKFIVVGETGGSTSDFLIARYLPDGTLDATFGSGGLITTDFFGGVDSARSVALDAQGRIVVAGWALRTGTGDFAVARYLPNGTLDTSFDADGRATVDFGGLDDRGSSLALGADGRIIVGGWTAGVQSCDMAAAVLTESGTLDTTFSKDGRVTLDIHGNQDLGNAILVQPNGAIVIGGASNRLSSVLANTTKDFVVARFTAAGVLDTTFSKDGFLFGPDDSANGTSNSAINALALRDDGHILFGGSLGGNILFGDLDASGGLRFYATDNFTSFQLGGSGSSAQAINDLIIAPDGKIIATGQVTFFGEATPHLFVKRYLPNFTLDANFGVSSSTLVTSLGTGHGLALAKDGGILAVANGFATADLLAKSATPKEGAFALDAISYSIAENGGSLVVTVTRPHEASYGKVTVDYATIGLTALPGQDFTPVAGTLTFRETETTKSFAVPIINDIFKEGVESFGIVLSNPTGGAQLSSASYAPVFIPANDTAVAPASFQLDDDSFSFVTEGFTFLTIKRTGSNLGAVTVDYHTEDGTAKAGEDYISRFGTLSFAAGETSKQITIPGISDDRIEGPETFYLKFTTPTGGSTLDLGLATLTLTIPDSVPNETFNYASRPDTTFDTDGRVATDSGVTGPDNYFALTQQPDGKTVAVGQAGLSGGFFLARYNADGSLDTSFGTGGKTVTGLGSDSYELALGVRIQANGKILVIGSSAADQIHEEIVMARYTKAGVLDKSFGKQGLARTPLLNIAALSFVQGTGGEVTVTPDGKFVLTALTRNGLDFDVSVLRFLPTGQLDPSFGVGGAVTYDRGLSDDRPSSIAAQPDGKLIVTFTDGLTRAVRLNANGSVDTTFGVNGTISANPPATLLSPGLIYEDRSTIQESLVLPNGDIMLLGQAYGSGKPPGSPLNFTEALRGGVLMLRYHSDGTPVTSFGTGGMIEVQGTNGGTIQDARLDEAGKIDILTTSTLIRVLTDGRADPGFGPNGTASIGASSALLVQPDGHLLVAGGSAFSPGDGTLSRYVGGPSAGAVRLNVLTEKVSETGGMLVIPVERIAGLDGPINVTISTSNGTATGGSDFTAISQTLSWADGEVGVKTITVPILNDLLADAAETFTVNLTTPTGGAVLSTRKTETVTIIDDDQPGVFEFSTAEFTAHENDATGLLTVTRKDGHLGPVSVHYSVTGGTAVAGQDFNLAAGTLNFADGEISKTISVSLLDDLILGEDKTVVVTLDTPGGGATLGTVPAARLTIVDNEVPGGGQFTLSSSDFEMREDGGGYLLTVLRVGGSDGAASVKLSAAPGTARSGLDFLPFDATLLFDPGQTSSSIFIPVFDNPDVNPERTVLVSLSEPMGSVVLTTNTTPTLGTASATLHITDNDAFPVRLTPGSLGFQTGTLTVSEGAGRVPIVVFRDEGSAGAVSVMLHIAPGTAENGRDLTVSDVLVEFADGEISKTVMVPLRNDFINESAEAFTVTLDTVTGGAALGVLDSTTVTITDDDTSPLPDFNNDGYADLVLLKAGKLYVHLNSADGPGQPVYSAVANSVLSSVKAPAGFVFGDFNNDGNTDLALLAVKTKSIFILPGHGDGTFGAPIAFASGPAKQPSTKSLLTADFNGDGRLDFAAQQARGINLVFNTSVNGTFSFAAPGLVIVDKGLANLTAADFNEDGRTDLLVTKGGPKPTANVYPGQGNGLFSSVLSSRLPKGMKGFNVVDLNTDGHLDLVGIFPKNNVGLLAGTGAGLFGGGTVSIAGKPVLIPTGKGPTALAVGDFNDDLSRDLLTLSAKKIASILVRNGSAFTASGTAATLFSPTGIAVADVNRDGDMDLVLFNKKDQFKVLIGGPGASFSA